MLTWVNEQIGTKRMLCGTLERARETARIAPANLSAIGKGMGRRQGS